MKAKRPGRMDLKSSAAENYVGQEWSDGLRILAGIIARRHLERRGASDTKPPSCARLITPQDKGTERAGR